MSTNNKKILFLSNGYGEDTIALYIIKNFPSNYTQNIEIFPLVTEGKIFKDYKIVGPVKVFPSRGISGFLNVYKLWQDIQAGLIRHIFKQIEFLKNINENFYFVAVGDIYPLILLYFAKKINKTFFVATAKSIKTEPFNILEILLMKKTIANFVRDNQTYEWILKKYKELNNVYFLGNPVLDIPYIKFLNEAPENNIIVLPGRINESIDNIKKLLPIMKKLKEFNFSIIIPDFYPVEEIKELIVNYDNVVIINSIYYRYFLENSFCVWGFGGSANEQAAGFGLPVISLYQKNWYRQRQKKLLKDSLILVEKIEDFEKETLKLKEEKDYYLYLSKVGREEMGPLGGAIKIANFIINFIS